MSTSTGTMGTEPACAQLATEIGERMSQLAGVMQVGTHQADVLRAVTIRYRMELNESRLRDLLAELSVDRPDIDDIARRFDEACSHTKSPIPGSPAARDGALAYV